MATEKLKILHVNTYDISGGAARAVYRLNEALNVYGIDSSILVLIKRSKQENVIGSERFFSNFISKIKIYLDSIPNKIYKTSSLFSVSFLTSRFLLRKINKSDADIIHIHWVCNGMLKIEDISKINKPVIWTFHDNWPYTGGCHIVGVCEKYEKDCGSCPVLGSKYDYDLSRWVLLRKKKYFSKINYLHIVSLSSWMKNKIEKSSIFKNRNISVLPNTLNTNVFRPFCTRKSRQALGLPSDKKLVLFGAFSATTDANKGYKELIKALSLCKIPDVELVVFGTDIVNKSIMNNFVVHNLGTYSDDIALSLVYSSCDVMVVPSKEESFGQTAVESLSCGLPVVCFNYSGLVDIVEHKINGFLAEPFSSESLLQGIEWILLNKKTQDLKINARKIAIKKFDYNIVSKKYADLYNNFLNLNE